ncbi:MAG: G protein-coupled receptor LGR4 [Verrucomicrobiales bacterium]
MQKALRDHSPDILAAAARRPHLDAVLRAVETSPGKVEKVNQTPEALKKALGAEITLFDTLVLVDLAMPNAGPHDHRKTDPYDAAFFEHLGHLTSLESLNIIATKLNDDWIAPLGKLTNLKVLRFTNNGKLTDAGMEQLAGLKNLESFSFVGTAMTGRAYAKCEGWPHLTKCSHRGSSIDDEGLKELCAHLPNLESISLAHAKFTDAGAVHLAELTKLTGLELGTHNATPQALRHLAGLPLEYLQLGEGFEGSESLLLIKDLATLRRLTLTNASELSDDDLRRVATMTQLEQLELGKIPLPAERLGLLKEFAFLKAMRLVPPAGAPYSQEIKDQIQGMLPKVTLTFQ